MKLIASTVIALTLALTAVAGQTAAVSASSVSGDSPRQDQRVTSQAQIEKATKTNIMCVKVLGYPCCFS